MEFDRNLFNVIMLGISFLLLFSAFQTTSMAEESVLLGERKITGGNFTGDGYTSLSIIYFSFAASNWVAPVIVFALGPRLSMFLSAIIYDLFIASFLLPRTGLLYGGSALLGLAAAVIWTAQGNYLSHNSTPITAGRNSGIFWALLQSSLIVGNVFLMIELKGITQIFAKVRTTLFLVFTGCGLAGTFCFVLLRKPLTVTEQVLGEAQDEEEAEQNGNFELTNGGQRRSVLMENWAVFTHSFKLAVTKKMLLLMPLFGYTGFELTFFSGVYGTCLGNMTQFGSTAKSYIGLAGLFIGIGEIMGGLAFSIFDKVARRCGRQGVVVFGFSVHIVSFFLAFLIVPNEAPKMPTSDVAYVDANVYAAMTCAFLLGLGDSSCNTQLYSYLSDKYKYDSASAFALFKFMQSLCAAIAFFYSNHLILQWQLLILVITGVLGTVGFVAVNAMSDIPPGYERVIQSDA